MFIYQIDKIPIRGVAEHQSNVSFKGEIIQPRQVEKVGFTNRYSVPETTKIKLRGTLTTRKDISPLNYLHSLIKIGGIPYIDVIGYLPNDFCDSEDQTFWFQTYGMITNIDRNYRLETNTSEQFSTMELDLELVINPYWTPLNRYQFFPYYGDDVPDFYELNEINETDRSAFDYDDQAIQEIVSATVPLYINPTIVDWSFVTPFVFYKNSSYDPKRLYNPIFWEKWALTAQGLASDNSDTINDIVHYNDFSGDILFTHYFQNLSGSDEIIVTIESEFGNTLLTNTSTLDLTALDNLLATDEYGNTSLVAKRIIVTNGGPYSSFVLDGNLDLVISSITGLPLLPDWEYSTRYPCELFPQHNRITINNGDEREFDYAFLFLNRVL